MKAIIFDMDGVLVDTPYIACEVTNSLLKDENVQFTQEQFKKYLKFGIEDRVRIWNKEFDKNINEQAFFNNFVDEQVEVLKEAMKRSDRKEILPEFKRKGFKLGLATRARKVKVDKILKALDLTNVFDSVITGDTTKKHKPHPEVYLNMLQALNVSAREAIVIEDSPHGIEAAQEAGIKVLAYKTRVFSDSDLEAADAIIFDLKEVWNYV